MPFEAMVRRSIPARILDERAFPIRIRLVDRILGDEALRLGKAVEWLRENLENGHYASHSMDGYGSHTRAFYFCRIQDAARFLEAFPECKLADATERLEHLTRARRARAREHETA